MEPYTLTIDLASRDLDDLTSPLNELAQRLDTFGVPYAPAYLDNPPTKSAHLLYEIAISLATLRTASKTILPLLQAWLNRPRTRNVTLTIADGQQEKHVSITVDACSPEQIRGIIGELNHIAIGETK